jgi:UrcA family protein
MSTTRLSPMVRTLLAGVMLAGAVAALPARAQDYQNDPAYYPDTQEDIVVQGRWGRVRDDVDTLSQRVSYADLDLRYADDRRELRHRIEASARYLCNRLGEDDNAASALPSCRETAVRDAMGRVGTVEAHYAPRGTAWAAPSYASYDRRYP